MRLNVRNDPRMAGQLRRWHSWPHVREQTVADHCWQVQRILLAIHPTADRDLLVYCMVHDVGEMGTGDMPYPVKKENPLLKKEADRIEAATHLAMCIPWALPSIPQISEFSREVFKVAEFIEMLEDGWNEMMLGNKFSQPVVDRCRDEIEVRVAKLAMSLEPGPDIAAAANWYIRQRVKEWGL